MTRDAPTPAGRSIESIDWMDGTDPSRIGFPCPVDRSRYQKEIGIAFKQTAEGPLELDAYRPQRSPGAPLAGLVVLFHGGAWYSGGRFQDGLTRWAGYLAQAGLSVVSADYRLAPKTTYPSSFEDCLAAIDWAIEHAGYLGADPQRVGLWGDSAGGHLALLAATSQTRADFGGPRLRCDPSALRCCVAWYPPSDLLTLHAAATRGRTGARSIVSDFIGSAPSESRERWVEASPFHQAHPGAPPTMLLHGTRDLLVPHAQSVSLAARLREIGAPHELHIAEGGLHGFDRVAPDDRARALIAASRAFALRHLAGSAGPGSPRSA